MNLNLNLNLNKKRGDNPIYYYITNWKDAARPMQETEIFLRAAHARMLVTHRALASCGRGVVPPSMLHSQASNNTTY